MPDGNSDRWQTVEARVEALSSTVKSVLATLVLRGVLNRADISALLHETETVLRKDGRAHPAGLGELRTIEEEMPTYLRTAVGPPPDPDEDDH